MRKGQGEQIFVKEAEDALEGYEGMLTLYERRIYPTREGIRNAIQVMGMTNEKIRSLKAENLVDDRFVKKLEQEGRFRVSVVNENNRPQPTLLNKREL